MKFKWSNQNSVNWFDFFSSTFSALTDVTCWPWNVYWIKNQEKFLEKWPSVSGISSRANINEGVRDQSKNASGFVNALRNSMSKLMHLINSVSRRIRFTLVTSPNPSVKLSHHFSPGSYSCPCYETTSIRWVCCWGEVSRLRIAMGIYSSALF